MNMIPEWYKIALQVGTWAHAHLVLQKRAREQSNEITGERSDHSGKDHRSDR